jgi:hypothetical protein
MVTIMRSPGSYRVNQAPPCRLSAPVAGPTLLRSVHSSVSLSMPSPRRSRTPPRCIVVVPGAKQTTSISYSQFKSKFGASSYSPPSMATPRAPAVAAAPLASAPYCDLPGRANTALEVGDLEVRGGFNPAQPQLKEQLLEALGADSGATVEAARGVQGGQNQGVWFVRSRSEDLVLKLVSHDRRRPASLIEGECVQRLAREHPDIVNDRAVAFPHKILRILDKGVRRWDLIVMSRAPGQILATTIGNKWYGGRVEELMVILEKVGSCLGAFHRRYGKNHGDMAPQNVFYDDKTGLVTLIDVGGMGCKTADSDVEHFTASLRQLAGCYGPRLALEGVSRFTRGHASAGAGWSRGGA